MKVLILILLLIVHLDLFSQQNNITLIRSNHSTCDGFEDTERIRQRIITQYFIKDTFFITMGIVAECSLYDPLIEITQSKDTLDFMITRKPVPVYNSKTKDTTYRIEVVECDCCYQFDFKISGLISNDYYIRVNNEHIVLSYEKYKTYPIQFELTNLGDTINYRDKYGLMQGIWIRKHRDGSSDKINFKQGKPISYKKFYPNGQLKCDCICQPNYDGFIEIIEDTGDCIFWDESGNKLKK